MLRTMPCWSCHEPAQGSFCGHCGAAQRPGFRLELDLASVQHFTAGHRCILRFRGAPVLVRSSAFDGLREGPDIDFVPGTAGQHEVQVLADGRFGGTLRVVVANPTTSAQANIHIGRVGIVENLTVGSKGRLLEGGDWAPIELRAFSDDEVEQFHLAGSSITTRKGEYRLTGRLGQGDFCTVYEAQRGADRVCVKVADDPADNDLVHLEARVLRSLHGKVAPQTKHIPQLLDQFTVDGRAGVALQLCDGFTLSALRERFPAGIEQRHVLWMTRRGLSTLGHAHSLGLLHGNVCPEHILVRPRDHNVWLLDWTASVIARDEDGFRVDNPPWSPPEVERKLPPLPSSDLYSLGRCMLWALGETSVDDRFRRFLEYFVRDSARQRPQDAWEMYRKLDQLREQMWGPHRFVDFVVP